MYKYFFLIYLLFLNLNVSAEIVKKIKITGNERLSKETIQVYGEVKLNEDYSSFDLGKF